MVTGSENPQSISAMNPRATRMAAEFGIEIVVTVLRLAEGPKPEPDDSEFDNH
jgi:hypothetical protein